MRTFKLCLDVSALLLSITDVTAGTNGGADNDANGCVADDAATDEGADGAFVVAADCDIDTDAAGSLRPSGGDFDAAVD